MEYRMYVLSERHLSPVQKAIQGAHALVEYQLEHGDTDEYKQWSKNDKTLIVLDGGNYDDMENDIVTLKDLGYKLSTFCEPDMNNMRTSYALIADERVWDKEKYPDIMMNDAILFVKTDDEICEMYGGKANCVLRGILREKRLAQ